MTKKTSTLYIRRVDDDFMQLVREFCVHRKMTIKAMVLLAVDQYMARYERKERRKAKED